MRADKYISEAGYTSRRKANDLLDEKRVLVNGNIAKPGTEIKDGDVVLIDGKKLIPK